MNKFERPQTSAEKAQERAGLEMAILRDRKAPRAAMFRTATLAAAAKLGVLQEVI